MARTTGPLHSETASGTLANMLTFSNWKGRSYVKQAVIPTDPKSKDQVSRREIFKFLSHAWGDTLDATDRASWQPAGDPDPTKNFNLYLARGMERWNQGLIPQQRPDQVEAGAEGIWNIPPTLVSDHREVQFNFRKAALGDLWGVILYNVPSDPTTPTHEMAWKIEPVHSSATTERHIYRKEPPGLYCWYSRPFTNTGKLLTLRNHHCTTVLP